MELHNWVLVRDTGDPSSALLPTLELQALLAPSQPLEAEKLNSTWRFVGSNKWGNKSADMGSKYKLAYI